MTHDTASADRAIATFDRSLALITNTLASLREARAELDRAHAKAAAGAADKAQERAGTVADALRAAELPLVEAESLRAGLEVYACRMAGREAPKAQHARITP